MAYQNAFGVVRDLQYSGGSAKYYSLPALQQSGFPGVARLPYSLKILLENLLRHEDNASVKPVDIQALANWDHASDVEKEIAFTPARVLLQDFTGVPAVVDLAAMRDAMARLGGDPNRVNPLQPMELVIDHSVQVDHYGTPDAFHLNADLEYARNRERYTFLRWGQNAFANFRVVPPETGIVHQVNLEYLARVVFRADRSGVAWAYPDTLVGTDSHTTMVNGLGVVGWGVGGIEAEAAMLGQPISMLIPPVVGFRLVGSLPAGTTATDLVLTVTERLRRHGVVGKFVEFFGPGLASLSLADRATLSNMCPEYGATVAIFPIDAMTIEYLRLTGRDDSSVALVEAYAKAQGLFADEQSPEADYNEVIEFDLATIEPSLAGPKRPQDRVPLSAAKSKFAAALPQMLAERKAPASAAAEVSGPPIDHGAVVVAAITSCTNTSNPSVLVAAGLLARKAVGRGLTRKPWVKTSLAPGSKVVTEYLEKAGLADVPRRARVQSGGVRVHDLYREQRPAARRGGGPDRGARPHRGVGAQRQPQFRRARAAACQSQLPGVAAARRRLRACRHDGSRPRVRAPRLRQGRCAGVPEGHLAERARDPGVHRGVDDRGDVPRGVCGRVRWR